MAGKGGMGMDGGSSGSLAAMMLLVACMADSFLLTGDGDDVNAETMPSIDQARCRLGERKGTEG